MNIKNEYTIKEISDLLNIDKQKISRYIKKNKIKNIKKNNQTFIYDEKTKNEIVEYFQKENKKINKEPIHKTTFESIQKNSNLEIENKILIEKNKNLNQIINILKDEINELKNDKKNDQEIIDRLTILLSNEQKNKNLSSPKNNEHNKINFWQRLFNK